MMGEKSKDINVVRKMFRGENEKVKNKQKQYVTSQQNTRHLKTTKPTAPQRLKTDGDKRLNKHD